jgi:hypothetical protein
MLDVMKRNDPIYQPGTLIRDFYDAPAAYYESRDIAWSPFTKIGSLADMPIEQEAQTPVRNKPVPNPVTMPVFPTGFTLNDSARENRSSITVRSRRNSFYTPPTRPYAKPAVTRPMRVLTALSTGAITTTSHAASNLQLIPKKYTLDKGVHADFSGRTFTIAKISLASMILVFGISWGFLNHLPSEVGQMPQMHGHRASQGGNVISNITNAASHSSNTSTSAPTTVWSGTPVSSSQAPMATTVVPLPNTSSVQPVGGYGGGIPVTSPLPVTPMPTQTVPVTPTTPVSPIVTPIVTTNGPTTNPDPATQPTQTTVTTSGLPIVDVVPVSLSLH